MNSLGRSERGGAAVEFALLTPVLCLLLVGVLEVGRIADAAMIARNAAREAARYAAVEDQNSSGISYQQRAIDYLGQAFPNTTGVTLPGAGDIQVISGSVLSAPSVEVRVPVTVNVTIPLLSTITGSAVQVWGDATMRVSP